ncbi:MAG: DUF3239 domain-containing protein, partial [Rikenellaceae bacterium]|nr:DUF3239 domain-containing protein [Rikenellaceae bacterium]
CEYAPGAWLTGLLWLSVIRLGVLAVGAAALMIWLGLSNLKYVYGRGRAKMYHNSLLIGAVVVREDPLTVLALTDVNTSDELDYFRYFDGEQEISSEDFSRAMATAWSDWEEQWEQIYLDLLNDDEEEEEVSEAQEIWDNYWDPVYGRFRREKNDSAGRWACMLYPVGSGDWQYAVGDRMPCSSGYGDDSGEIWTSMQVIPLVWGTKNREDLKRCVEAIPDFEWELLDKLAPMAEQMQEKKLYLVRRLPQGRIGFEPVTVEITENWNRGTMGPEPEAEREIEAYCGEPLDKWDQEKEDDTRAGEKNARVTEFRDEWDQKKEDDTRAGEKCAAAVELNDDWDQEKEDRVRAEEEKNKAMKR